MAKGQWYEMPMNRFSSKTGITEEIVIAYFIPENYVYKEYEHDPASIALFEHPGYRGIPIWSSWMFERGQREKISEWEAQAIIEGYSHYQERFIPWLREELQKEQRKLEGRITVLQEKNLAFTQLLRETLRQTYGTQTAYIHTIVREKCHAENIKHNGLIANYQRRLDACLDYLETYCK